MTTKEKYELIDKTKINEKVLAILQNMEKSSSNFTDEAVNSKIDGALDKLIEGFRANKPEALRTLPEAKKEVKKEKEKATKENEGKDLSDKKDTDDKTGLPKKDTLEERKDIIKKQSESEKEARDRARKELEKEKEKAQDEVESQIEKLNRIILEDPSLRGFNTGTAATGGGRSTPIIDAERKALPRGSRVSQKGWKNQYGASDGGRKYWENRENRSDRKSPEYETGKPYLAKGGNVYSSDELYIVKVYDGKTNELLDMSKRVFARNLQKAKEEAIDNYEYDMKQKYGDDLLFKVEEAPSMFADGGMMADGGEVEGVDLFEDYDDQPEEVQAILANYEMEDNDYETLQNLKAELESIGYTMEFGLDAEPYDLRKIGEKGKSEFYAKGGMMAEGGEVKKDWYDIRSYSIGEYGEDGAKNMANEYIDQHIEYYKGEVKKDDLIIRKSPYGGQDFKGEYVVMKLLPKFAKGGFMADGGMVNRKELNKKIKDYYIKTYPTDKEGKEINDKITFKRFWAYLSQGYDVYEVLEVADSLIRERVFEKLSEIYAVDYDVVYNMWLRSDKYDKGGQMADGSKMDEYGGYKVTFQDNTEDKLTWSEYVYANSEPQAILRAIESLSRKYPTYHDFSKMEVIEIEEGEKYAKGGEMADGGVIADIEKIKKSLISKAKAKGIYENFGQKEVRQLEDKYGHTASVQNFDNWVANFDLSQMADGGEMENRRTLKFSDTVLYKDEMYEFVKKDGEVGFVSHSQGAWGMNGRFLPLGRMYRSDLEENLTDMYGNKFYIPNYEDLVIMPYGFAKGGMMADGGELNGNLYRVGYLKVYENDEEGDTVYTKEIYGDSEKDVSSKFKKIHPKHKIEFISKYAEGGEVDFSERMAKMRSAYENLNMIVKSRIAVAIGIDRAISIMENDYSIDPFGLITSAVRGGLLELDEINKDLVNEAVYEAERVTDDYRDSGQGIGGSDMTYFTKSVLDSAGYKTGFVNNRLTRVDADGNELVIDKYEMNY